jgi:hypothetical protein
MLLCERSAPRLRRSASAREDIQTGYKITPLLHKGDISLRVGPVALQSGQAFPDLSPSNSQPAIATRKRLRCEAEQAFRE